MNIGIVGGGIAGLTAAYRLSLSGHTVSVFEKDEKLGGLARSVDFAGTRIDRFYRHIFKSDIDIIKLIRELGLEKDMLWVQTKMGFRYGGVNYDFTSPMDLLRFKPLSFIDRIKQGIMALYLQKVKNYKKYEKITAKEWVEKYLGKRIYEVIWGALLKQKFGEHADEIAMTWLYGRIHSRAVSREKGGAKEVLGYMKGSYQVLIDTLEREIAAKGGKIFTGTPVSRVMTEEGKVKGLKAGGNEYEFDAVLMTCAPAIASTFVDFEGEYGDKLKKLDYYGAMNLIFRTKKSLSGIYWMNVTEQESPFLAVIEHTNFIPKENYGNDVVVYLSKYLSPADKLYKAPPEEVKERFFGYLKKVFPEFDEADVLEYRVYREPFSQPIVRRNYSAILPEHKTPVKGVFLADMSQIFPEDRGMSYSVRLGNTAAKIINEESGR
ncbi:MAG: NAD(P)/FAD-dependent oxidoreductase [Candidatus Goldiibacteriota bacterium]